VKQAFGKITGNAKTRAGSTADEATDRAECALGRTKEASREIGKR
jgi:uncharacterized protein YjbJ (UPF0337 family)